MTPYKLPLGAAEDEFIEKKSRFIGHVSPVASEDEARAFLQSIRARHREASHNVYAYRIKENGICRHSDDGEPSGTAGMPLLNVFLKQDIYDFCCVATRYYGGIMLGAGGLTRAYSRCGSIALEAAGIGMMREMALCKVKMPYTRYENMKRLLLAGGADISSEDFGAEVEIEFAIKTEDVEKVQGKITELTAGTLHITEMGTRNAVGFE
ncbi:MAG: YigZ family protein [Defluviitaleaceae bacterium]|nr:YigZ family protein [Defluviitaleaceae bacterium]